MVQIEFEAGLVSVPDRGKRAILRLAWFADKHDLDSPTVNYRPLYFARALEGEFESIRVKTVAQLEAQIQDLDAVIVSDCLDQKIMELANLAWLHKVPIFLDLSHDLLRSGHPDNEDGLNLLRFTGVVPRLAGVIVPNAQMSDRMQRYSEDAGIHLGLHVVPDVAETWEFYKAAALGALGNDAAALKLPDAPVRSPLSVKQVVWFGDCGSASNTSGMFALKSYLRALSEVHQEIPLELVVVSNSEAVYKALVHQCGFPSRYVNWSRQAVYATLAAADVALLPTGSEPLSSLESLKRVTQALAANVPVITQKSPSLVEFEDAIFFGRVTDALRLTLGPTRETEVSPRLAEAHRVLGRYSARRLADTWAALLKSAISKCSVSGQRENGLRTLIVVTAVDDPLIVKSVLLAANRIRGLDYDILIPTEILEEGDRGIRSALRKGRVTPRFYSGNLTNGRDRLAGYSALVLGQNFLGTGCELSEAAVRLGIPVLTMKDAASGSLDGLAMKVTGLPAVHGSSSPGPYPERLNADGSVDWAFIVDSKGPGWILDAICREIGSRQPRSWKVVYHPDVAPSAKNIFFSHYALFDRHYVDEYGEKLSGTNVFVWYTHPRQENPVTIARLLSTFERTTKVIFASDSNRQLWIERGLSEDKAVVVLGGADPTLFKNHERGQGKVGLSSSFYERKNPDILLEIVKTMPHREFELIGKNWERYANFEELKSLPNFEYNSVPYSEYPKRYANFDVFLSMSTLEGGPIPLIEAMMSNAVPVASRTGFAPDLISHGKNGFLFDLTATAREISSLIEAAFELPANVRETVLRYDWDNFSAEIGRLGQ
jgi:glycosyltransferase involved in cell wall biosynthesis